MILLFDVKFLLEKTKECFIYYNNIRVHKYFLNKKIMKFSLIGHTCI